MLRSLGIVVLMLMLSACAKELATSSAPPLPSSKLYGQTLVSEFRLDGLAVDKLNKHQPSKPGKHESQVEAVMFAKTEDWRSTPIEARQKNPYSVVVTMTATALADGDAVGTWHAGFRDQEGTSKLAPFVGLSKMKVKAGERFTITAPARAAMLEQDQPYQAELGLVKLDNMKLDALTVQVWSGVSDASPLQAFFSFQWLLMGAVGILIWRWMRR